MFRFYQSFRAGRWEPKLPRPGRWALLVLLFAALAIWSFWPALRFPQAVLPAGQSTAGTIPMLNAWTIWWNADRLANGLAGYWDAPIFYPERGAFAFSEPQPATWVVAPVVWLSGSPMPAYHVYLVVTLVLNGLFAVRLLRTLKTTWTIAVAGGIAVLLHPLVHYYGDVVQMMSLWGVLWTLDVLIKLRRQPISRRGLELGVAFASVFLSSIHHGLFLTLLLAFTGWIIVPLRAWRRWSASAAIAAAVATLALLPLLLPMWQILERQSFSRRLAVIQSLSATPAEWLQTPSQAMISVAVEPAPAGRALSPGWMRIGLSLLATGALLPVCRRRRAVLFLLAVGLCALVLSFGLHLQIGSWRPWLTLAEFVPGFSQVRSAFRFAYFAQLIVIVLASLGIDVLRRGWRTRLDNRPLRWLRAAVLTVLAAVVAFEIPPAPPRLVGVPDISTERAWTTYLRVHTPPGRAIVCLPFATGHAVQQFDQTTRWMLYGTQHQAPLVNGYSGFFPRSWFLMARMLNRDPFAEATLEMLAEIGVEFVVVQPGLLGDREIAPAPRSRFRLQRVFHDSSGVEIWQLRSVQVVEQ